MSGLKEAIISFSDLIEKILGEATDPSEFNDLTNQQFSYLKTIVRLKNPTLTGLARELGLTKPTVSVLVDKLTQKGYVKRVHSEEDKRVIHLYIDEKGERINMLYEIALNKITEKIRSCLSEKETTLLTELLDKIGKY